MIRANRLTKYYGKIVAIRDVSFEVQPGEILGFLGPNGAGKSTTLRILCGYLPPSSGSASIAGKDLIRQSVEARRHLGYLPEAFAAPPELRVQEYLRFRAQLKGLKRLAAKRRVAQVAELLGLTPRLKQTFGALSKGYRQRVGLADALLNSPPALLLDEPFGGLDPLQRQEFRTLLQQLAQEGIAILFSSHVLPEVEDIAHRILILHEGTAQAVGSQAELSAAALGKAPVRFTITGNAEALEQAFAATEAWRAEGIQFKRAGRNFEVELPTADMRQQLLQWLVQREEDLTEFRVMAPTLEDLFRQYVDRHSREQAS